MANPKDVERARSGDKSLAEANLWGANLRGASLRGANLWGTDLRGANLSGADLRNANLSGADLSGADLREASLRGANLRGASLRGASLWGANLRGASVKLIQITGKPVDLSGLPQALLEHAESKRYSQFRWGDECGTTCCMAGRAAEYIGLPGNSGTGVIAVWEAIPGFDVEVLYQSKPEVAISELKRAIGALSAKDTQDDPDSFLAILSKKYDELGNQCTQLKADVENASKHVADLQARLNKASICQGAVSDLLDSIKELEADTATTSQDSDSGMVVLGFDPGIQRLDYSALTQETSNPEVDS